MRVIAGTAKGHRLKFPKGAPTRPATDLVKGAIFSILENMAGEWNNVLDLFSGSGQLGIEALSRGAGWADFVDRDRRCCAIIKENLEKTGLAGKAQIFCSDIARTIPTLDKEYDIILMDPPYADTTVGGIIEQLANSSLFGKATTLVITHSPHFRLEPSYAALKQVKEHRHGDSCIAIYRKEAQV